MRREHRMCAKDIIVVGFAMFATFFGAGNLIFPPYLGMNTGSKWFIGFLCFILADAGLAILTVMAMIRGGGSIWCLLQRLGKHAATAVGVIVMLCVGPLVCVPRTCATTFEMGIQPLLPGMNSWLFGVIFFVVVYLLTVRPSRVIDIVGKVLTPILLLTLAVLFVKGILQPIGDIKVAGSSAASVAKEGFLAGYQTMDVLGAMAITLVVVGTVAQKGYTETGSQLRLIAAACAVAAVGLFAVYCGLTYLGATASQLELGTLNQAGLVVAITELLLNRFGVVLLALIVTLACLTTAIGLVSACAEFFAALSKGKWRYERIVLLVCIAGTVISNVGISVIIAVATPILNVIYPVLLTQIVLAFFDRTIPKNTVCQGAALGALVAALLGVAGDYGLALPFLQKLPFASIGFFWVTPAIAGGLLGALIPGKTRGT